MNAIKSFLCVFNRIIQIDAKNFYNFQFETRHKFFCIFNYWDVFYDFAMVVNATYALKRFLFFISMIFDEFFFLIFPVTVVLNLFLNFLIQFGFSI
jgi:hypothetical protein